MRAPAQVDEVTLPVGGRADVVPYLVVHDLELERIAAEHLAQRVVAVLLPFDDEVLLDERLHALPDGTQLLVPDRVHVEVVVEAVLDRRADGRPGVRVQLCDGLGQQMGAGVAEDVEAGLGRAVN